MRSPQAAWRRPPSPEPTPPGPLLCVTCSGGRVLISVRRDLDPATALVFRDAVAAAVSDTGHPSLVEIDLLAVPWCSTTSLEILGDFLERGVRLRLEELDAAAVDSTVAGAAT